LGLFGHVQLLGTATMEALVSNSDDVRGELRRALDLLDDGRRISEELTAGTLGELLEALALLDRAALEKVALYQLLRGPLMGHQ
jgi:hypothetical protein